MNATARPDLNDIATFVRVVEAESFSAAGRALGVPTSTVSRRVARLEDRVGTRLLHRNTRRLSLTDAGRIYFESCARGVAEIAEADRALAELQSTPRGTVRITAPGDMERRLSSVVTRFLSAHPEVRLEIMITDRMVDLVDERVDVALRGDAALADSSLVGRKLADVRRVLVASPAYLDEHGRPERVADLADHECVLFTPWSTGSTWTLECGGKKTQVKLRNRIVVNDFNIVNRAAIAGFGIAQTLDTSVGEAIEDKRLELVLPGACPTTSSLWMCYPTRRHVASAVRAFIEFVAADPIWNSPPLPAPSGRSARSGRARRPRK